jgi:hypothetical protein
MPTREIGTPATLHERNQWVVILFTRSTAFQEASLTI